MKRRIDPTMQTLTAQQIAWKHTWFIYALSATTGLRKQLRFRWNLESPDFEDGALELRVFHRTAKRYSGHKWWQDGEDFTLGLTMEGSWYVYAWHCHYSNVSGPETYETHLGDFPGFETAFFAMLTAIAKDTLDLISERRHERHMDKVHQRLEQSGALDPL